MRHKLSLFQILKPTLVGLSVALSSVAQSSPVEPWVEQFSYGGIRVFSRDSFASASELEARFKEFAPALLSSVWLKNALPSHWSILIDGTLGPHLSPVPSRAHTQLKDGAPGILLSVADFMNPYVGPSLFAHEASHLAHWQTRVHEESWVAEGVAMLLTWKLTASHPALLSYSFDYPESSLVASLDSSQPGFEKNPAEKIAHWAQYGHVHQFFWHLLRHCGGGPLFQEILKSPSTLTGVKFIDSLLREFSAKGKLPAFCADFSTFFKAFEIARFAQDYANPERFTFILPDHSVRVRENREDKSSKTLPPYSASAYRKDKKCDPRDIEITPSRCLRLRE